MFRRNGKRRPGSEAQNSHRPPWTVYSLFTPLYSPAMLFTDQDARVDACGQIPGDRR